MKDLRPRSRGRQRSVRYGFTRCLVKTSFFKAEAKIKTKTKTEAVEICLEAATRRTPHDDTTVAACGCETNDALTVLFVIYAAYLTYEPTMLCCSTVHVALAFFVAHAKTLRLQNIA